MDTDRGTGILGTVPGQFVVRAMYSLPPAGETQPPEASLEMFVPRVGRVRFTFELAGPVPHKRAHWCWQAKSADLLPGRA